MPDQIIKDFTVEEAKQILSAWAVINGYSLGVLKKFNLWFYTITPFYSAEAWLSSEYFQISGLYAFHIHLDGEVIKFKLEDPDNDECC